MTFKLKYALLFLSISFIALSCAKEPTRDEAEIEVNALRAWMKSNHPDYPEVEEGLFYKIIPNSISNEKPDTSADWIHFTYNGRDLTGDYYANTYKELSKQLGTFAYTTHFVPLYAQFFPNGSSIPLGVYKAMLSMNVGDSVDIFMSSRWAFGSIGSGNSGPYTGFGGNVSIGVAKPARYSMKLHDIVSDPYKYELASVEKYVVEELKMALNDSIKTGFYSKTIDAKPTADTISSDTTIRLRYTGRFLDGFVFDTNVEKVANDNNIYKKKEDDSDSADPYAPIDFNYSTSSFVTGFKDAVKKMRVGETIKTVFVSRYGYSINGNSGGATAIMSHEPLEFEITVLKPDDK